MPILHGIWQPIGTDDLAPSSVTGDSLGSNDVDLFHFRNNNGSSSKSNVTRPASPAVSMAAELARCVQEIDKWGFVEGYWSIGEMVWDLLINQRESGNFFRQMDRWMAEGYQSTVRLENLLGQLHTGAEGQTCLETISETSQWLSLVHRSIEALNIRQELVHRQGIEKAAEMLCPQNIP